MKETAAVEPARKSNGLESTVPAVQVITRVTPARSGSVDGVTAMLLLLAFTVRLLGTVAMVKVAVPLKIG